MSFVVVMYMGVLQDGRYETSEIPAITKRRLRVILTLAVGGSIPVCLACPVRVFLGVRWLKIQE